MPNARIKPGETAETAKARYNAEMRDYRARRTLEGRSCNYRTSDKVRANDLRKRYGISVEEYDRMKADQGNACAICTRSFNDANIQGSHEANCVVDHCHTTGKVRGLLCPSCNLGVGKFNDCPDTLRAAAKYLLP